MRGPRGLALNAAQSRLYVYNRIDHSVTVVNANFTNPAAAVIGNFPLQKDPTPAYIKAGRKFLYSSTLSGGNNVSCASCHIDATSDFLAWNLSDGVHVGPPLNPLSGGDPLGALGPNTALDPASPIPDRKGPMQTQSLRGLVNFEVANDARQDEFFSNKPYHWRGDRATFQDFNGAFIHLMAINPPFSPTQGIAATDMTAYREFINSVHYPPNPEQPLARTYSGSMLEPNPNGSPAPLDDPVAGSGAQQGLKNFHVHNTDGRACVHCHSLPEGSNNRQTDMFAHVNSQLDRNRLETTALRALVSKEAQLWRFNATTGLVEPKLASLSAPIATGEFGLIHTGKTTLANSVGSGTTNGFGSRSIVDFLFGFGLMNLAQINAMARFMRELDTGVAPTVGRTLAVTTTSPAGTTLAEMEQQATRANAGLAAFARLNGVLRGFWFDVTRASTTPYIEEPHTGVTPLAPMTRAQLLALVVNSTDLLVFQNTPLGATRRVAFLDGGLPPTLAGGAPTGIVLRGCRPNNANANVPALTGEWLSLFQSTGYASNLNTNLGNNKAMIYYQASLKHHAATATPPGFGLADFRHEPPRRFVVTGTGIREGAWLRIYLPDANDWATASSTAQPTTTPDLTSHPNPIEVPVFGAIDRATGLLEWQSAVEIEPYHLLALLNGGPANPTVQTAITSPGTLDPFFPNGGTNGANPFDPMLHNWYFVQVINDPADPTTASAGVWQRMKLQ